jgi:hypothetical protein
MCLLSEDDCERDLDPPQRNRIITLKGKFVFPLMHLKRSRPSPARSKSKPQRTAGVENLMTLKQACSSEYQGAQGAFKDSMIH